MTVIQSLLELLRGRRVVALTGAGCSTESGIPDYRGPDAPTRTRPPIQHREFMEQPAARRRYWARSMLGWPRLAAARPNPGHEALAELERAGTVVGVITQNVDGLHHGAGSREIVELHGALRRVRCLECGGALSRDELQQQLAAANPGWLARGAAIAPDGDAELPDDAITDFEVIACAACAGALMPDVVFFGGTVPADTLAAAWAIFDRAEVLLVIGSSLTVFSGYRFVRRAAERAVPVAIINRGPTRGDPHAAICVDARVGDALPALARYLAAL